MALRDDAGAGFEVVDIDVDFRLAFCLVEARSCGWVGVKGRERIIAGGVVVLLFWMNGDVLG